MNGATRLGKGIGSTERQLMQALAEILGPVQNPRYLLVRKTSLGWKRRVDSDPGRDRPVMQERKPRPPL